MIVNIFFSKQLAWPREVGFYINLGLQLIMMISLVRQERLQVISKQVDKRIGQWAYPIFLMHFQAKIILSAIAPDLEPKSMQFALGSLPILFVFIFLMNRLIVKPVEKIRRIIKPTPSRAYSGGK
jgi:peptidoglycan/LPS O-acetylase OafA/YrhL